MGLFDCWEKQQTKHQHYFEPDYKIVANELIYRNDDIRIQGMYKKQRQHNICKSVELKWTWFTKLSTGSG